MRRSCDNLVVSQCPIKDVFDISAIIVNILTLSSSSPSNNWSSIHGVLQNSTLCQHFQSFGAYARYFHVLLLLIWPKKTPPMFPPRFVLAYFTNSIYFGGRFYSGMLWYRFGQQICCLFVCSCIPCNVQFPTEVFLWQWYWPMGETITVAANTRPLCHSIHGKENRNNNNAFYCSRGYVWEKKE